MDGPMSYQTILVSQEGPVGIVTFNRPQALNALNSQLMDELTAAIDGFEADDAIRCVILTGSEKAFAAGADIVEMQAKSFAQVYTEDFITKNWERVARARKPVIAAVAGFALGGGCELAMMCDFILAADNAKFGQPEINLGIGPGAGGTQRLTRAIGKAKAMEMCLTGRMMDAAEAERAGLVARVVPLADLMAEAMKAAKKIASASLPAMMMVKECIGRAPETSLAEGLRFERRLFHALFATEDQKEGMAAFVEKRKPAFKDC
jgi:enoyl-CoA hydratase